MRNLKAALLPIALLFFLVVNVGAYVYSTKPESLSQVFTGPTNNLRIDTASIAPPDTDPFAQPDFDIFAWNSFIALNWPAIVPDTSNGFLRGIPNTSSSFANAKPEDLLVWETYKEKREIFNQSVIRGSGSNADTVPMLFPWNHQVDYGILRPANDDIDPISPNTGSSWTRIFSQSRKQSTPYNAFDETAEVGSEVLEDTLPNGEVNPTLGRPVGPRVWKGLPSDSLPVLYEVKLNYDYYNYIKANNLFSEKKDSIAEAASLAQLRLPYRTSSKFGPKGQSGSSKYALKTGYDAGKTADAYRQINKSLTGNPPLIGSMQFKAAWVKLDSTRDEISKYHLSKALYYNTVDDSIQTREGLFGLIGLHIIQRVHTTNRESDANPTGGTFIFATWEHTSLRSDTTTYTYSNYYNPEVDPAPVINGLDTLKQNLYPQINWKSVNDGVYVVKPKFDILSNPGKPEAPATAEVNAMVHSMLPATSIWRNYQLVGTQFIAIDVDSDSKLAAAGKEPRYPISENDPQGIGLPVYLANIVVETNLGLQYFKGQPPGTVPINNYQGAGVDVNNTVNFLRDNTNTSYNRIAYNMGGCMGCHGVAQSKGYSFSFVLLGGRDGAKTDTETHFEIPPLVPDKK